MRETMTDRERFAAAVAEHSHSMYRAARAVLDCDADAEDAVGEAILRAWQARDKLRDRGRCAPGC